MKPPAKTRWNSTFPVPLSPDGSPRWSSFTHRTGLPPVSRSRTVPLLGTGRKSAATRKAETGFSKAVRLAVRKRAGGGSVEEARCECCGVELGRYGGQVQHVVARGMGGTSNPVLSTAANGALLCGTAQSGDHGLAESRDKGMQAKGFWLPQGTDPRLVPMTLWSGAVLWRAEDGKGPDGTGYLKQQPEARAA